MPESPPYTALESSVHLPASVQDVFRFVSDPRNLDAVTPPWFRLHFLAPPDEEVGTGTIFDYRMTLFRVPFRWRSRVVAWEPPVLFTYVQDRGPYLRFEHEHRMEATPLGTRVIDRFRFRAPGGAGVDRLLVRRMLEGILEWRGRELVRRFPGHQCAEIPGPSRGAQRRRLNR